MAKETTTQALRSGFRLKSKDRIYEIVGVLGSGSFGITYHAKAEVSIDNISAMVKFAIKEHFMSASCYRGEDGATVLTVPTAKSDVVDSRADFITEANRLKKLCLKSRNIVSVNETFEANGTAYYVMEFLDGGSPSKCSEDDAVSIVMQIADALTEIHKDHVLHLDLKPDNIVLKTNNKNETYPVLIDFGISKHFDSKGRPTSSLSAKGASPGYAPQEQYADVTEFSPKYDIYALGAVLFYLCTGKNPPDAFKISPNQQELKKELAGKVSSKVEKTILNAMKPAAMERTPSIKQFCDDLMGIDFVPVLNVSTSGLEFSKEKGERSVSVESNIGWTVYAKEDWCKVSKDDNNIIISVSKNKESGNRLCDVVINGSTYPISQVIHIKQDGLGTVVFPSGTTWWERNYKKVYQAAGILFAGCFIAWLCEYFKPLKLDPEAESKLLTEAIEAKDGAILEKYAKLDSARAFLPFAEYLYEQGRYYQALTYATKAIALGRPTSTRAEELVTILKTEIDHIQQEYAKPEQYSLNSLTNLQSENGDSTIQHTISSAQSNVRIEDTPPQRSTDPTSNQPPISVQEDIRLTFEKAVKHKDFETLDKLASCGFPESIDFLSNYYLNQFDYNIAFKYAKKKSTPLTILISSTIEYINQGNTLYVKWKDLHDSESRIEALDYYNKAIELMPSIHKDSKIIKRIKELENA